MLQSGLDGKWWADSMDCYCYMRNIQDLLADGRTPYERRFGEPFRGPAIPFGSMVEYHPISAKDLSRLHQFGKKVLPEMFLGYALVTGRHLEGDILIADIVELGKIGRIRNPRSKGEKFDSQPQTAQHNCLEEIMKFENQLWGRMNLQRVKSSAKNFKEARMSLKQQKQRGTPKPATTSGRLKATSFVVIMFNLEFVSECQKKNHSQYHWSVVTWPGQLTQIWMWCKKSVECC